MIKLNFILCALVSAIFGASAAYAFPLPTEPMSSTEFDLLQPVVSSTEVNFQGIIKLSNCSGALVRYVNSVDTDQAMVLTNGHCVEGGFPKAGEVRVNLPSSRHFELLTDTGRIKGFLKANRIIVSTMTKTDMTLYGLTQSFGELKQKYGVQALTISPAHPVAKAPIAVVSGYFKIIYSCKIDTFIYNLREAGWDMYDSMRYSSPGCETIHGTSGSPVINPATNEIVGINNTGNDDGKKCTMDNPCEIDERGNVTVNIHASYAQETFWLYSCLNQQKQFDLSLPSCILRP